MAALANLVVSHQATHVGANATGACSETCPTLPGVEAGSESGRCKDEWRETSPSMRPSCIVSKRCWRKQRRLQTIGLLSILRRDPEKCSKARTLEL
mmetsp:Transcript_731/g.2861  ORF Transcript_731/g.2861 Transcript_731/m.2861 type:complete len:96 (+) Transcript_731:1371-1658(+)